MKYAVTITETLQRTVFVDAPDKGQAGYIVGKKYKNGEIVLSADDFLEAEFSTKEAYEEWSTSRNAR